NCNERIPRGKIRYCGQNRAASGPAIGQGSEQGGSTEARTIKTQVTLGLLGVGFDHARTQRNGPFRQPKETSPRNDERGCTNLGSLSWFIDTRKRPRSERHPAPGPR